MAIQTTTVWTWLLSAGIEIISLNLDQELHLLLLVSPAAGEHLQWKVLFFLMCGEKLQLMASWVKSSRALVFCKY